MQLSDLLSPARQSKPAFWPTPQQQLLLKSSLLEKDAALAAWSALQPSFSLGQLDPGSMRLLPLLQAQLQRFGADDSLPAELANVRRMSWVRNRQILAEGEKLLRRFTGQFPIIILKGAALAERLYGDLSLRPFSDVDVLVPPGKLRSAYRIARQEQWAAANHVSGSYLRLRHAINISKPPNGSVDIHSRLLYLGLPGVDDSDIWHDAVPIAEERFTLSDTGHLLQACIHGIPWGPVPSIRWIADSYLLIQRGGIDWTRLVELAKKRECTFGLLQALICLKELFECPIPDATLQTLRETRHSPRERLQFEVVSRHWPLLGQLPSIMAYYVRHLEHSRPRTWFDGPAHFRASWGLRSLGEVAPAFVERAVRRTHNWVVNGGDETAPRRR